MKSAFGRFAIASAAMLIISVCFFGAGVAVVALLEFLRGHFGVLGAISAYVVVVSLVVGAFWAVWASD